VVACGKSRYAQGLAHKSEIRGAYMLPHDGQAPPVSMLKESIVSFERPRAILFFFFHVDVSSTAKCRPRVEAISTAKPNAQTVCMFCTILLGARDFSVGLEDFCGSFSCGFLGRSGLHANHGGGFANRGKSPSRLNPRYGAQDVKVGAMGNAFQGLM